MGRLKIFHGLSEVAGQAYYSVKGLREAQVKTQHVVWEPSAFQYGYDISLNIDGKKKYQFPIWVAKIAFYEVKILLQNNVFHFHYGRSLLFNYDLGLIRFLRKKLFFEFHGSDVRNYQYARELNKYMFCDANEGNVDKLNRRTEKICKYADGVILHDDELIPHLPDGYKKIYVVPLRLDLQQIVPFYVKADTERKVRIVHAPTNREVKGSQYVIDAVSELQDKYEIELILVENKSQQEALELYKQADIIVDQIRIGTYGVFAIEGMAMGKPVVTYITDEMKQRLPEDLPICSANPDTIREVLEKLICDAQMRQELGVKGRAYVEKYHDYRKNAKVLSDIYSGEVGPIQGREAFEYASRK